VQKCRTQHTSRSKDLSIPSMDTWSSAKVCSIFCEYIIIGLKISYCLPANQLQCIQEMWIQQ